MQWSLITNHRAIQTARGERYVTNKQMCSTDNTVLFLPLQPTPSNREIGGIIGRCSVEHTGVGGYIQTYEQTKEKTKRTD
jgi:hypothetical protein